jgi:acyl CoA:acetate/3-ketoacid CoA transferase beta subunit
VRALVTDLGTLEKVDGDELVLTAVPAGDGSITERIENARAACGWDLDVARDVQELPPPTAGEIVALRRWDSRGWFLRDR